MTAPHTLTVRRDPDPTLSPDIDLECPVVTVTCRAWYQCKVPECPGNNGGGDTLHDVSPIAHGVMHRYFDEGPGGYWGVPSGECYVINHGHAAAEEFADEHRLGSGSYEVLAEVDDTTVIFTLVPAQVA